MSPESSRLGVQDSGHCKSRYSPTNDLKLLQILGSLQQAQGLVNRVVLLVLLLFSTEELMEVDFFCLLIYLNIFLMILFPLSEERIWVLKISRKC